MLVMVRMKNSCFFYKLSNFNSLLCKIISQSQLSLYRLSFSPDLCIVTYSDKRSDLSKYLIENKGTHQEEEKKKHISIKEFFKEELYENSFSELSENNHGKGKQRLLDTLKTYSNVKTQNSCEEENSVPALSFSYKQGKEDQLKADKNFKKENAVNEELKNLLHGIQVNQKKKTSVNPEVIQNDLNNAVQFFIKHEEKLVVHHLIWIAELLYESSKIWTSAEKTDFIGSLNFKKIREIFIRLIPRIPNEALITVILPLFVKLLEKDYEDIIFFKIFEKISVELKNLTPLLNIRILKDITMFEDSEMMSEIKELLVAELDCSYRKKDPSIYNLYSKNLLSWAMIPSVADDIKIMALQKLLIVPNKHQFETVLPKCFQIFYSLSEDLRKDYASLEDAAKSQAASLVKNQNYYGQLCKIILVYGRVVSRGTIQLDRRFVDNILNNMNAFSNQNINLLAKYILTLGLYKMRHINHKFLGDLENYVIDNFENIEKIHAHLYLYFKILADSDFSSKSNNWPFLKILLQNSRHSNIKELHRFPISRVLHHLTLHSLLLSSVDLFSKNILDKISALNKSKQLARTLDHVWAPLLFLNEIVADRFLRESGRPLISEEILQIFLDERNRFLKEDFIHQEKLKLREKYKTCLEKAVGLKDSVLSNLYTRLKTSVHLTMAFNDENKPYCLRDISKEGTPIEDINFPINSKIVVVKICDSEDYFEYADGKKILRGYSRLKVRLFENLGFQVMCIDQELIENLTDNILGYYVYDQIKKKIEQSSVD